LVLRELRELKVIRVTLVLRELRELKAIPVHKELRERKAILVLRELRERKAILVTKDHRAHKDLLVLKEALDLLSQELIMATIFSGLAQNGPSAINKSVSVRTPVLLDKALKRLH
jgi:hypothetical protein